MTGYIVGIDPGRVYTNNEAVNLGKCPVAGTIGTTGNGNVYKMVEVTTGNLTDGLLVTISAANKATVAAVANAGTVAQELGVLRATVTASGSMFAWAQIYGRGTVMASAAANANVALGMGAVAGTVDDGGTSASAVIDGLFLTASAGASSALTAAIIRYPTFEPI